MAWNASFGVFQPSDSVLRALQAKVGLKVDAARYEADAGSGAAAAIAAGSGAPTPNAASAAAFSVVAPAAAGYLREESPAPRAKRNSAPPVLRPDQTCEQDSPTRNSEMRRPRPQEFAPPSAAPHARQPPYLPGRVPRIAGGGAAPSSSSSAPAGPPPRASSHGAEHPRAQGARRPRPAPEISLLPSPYGSAAPSPSHGPQSASSAVSSAPRGHYRAEPSELLRPPRLPAAGGGMAEAADAALAAALSHLGGEQELRKREEPPFSMVDVDDVAPQEIEMSHIPSVVTFGGQPVAADGDLIYLGGGLYASAVPPPMKETAARAKPRIMPGRVRTGARAAVGRNGMMRSNSARGSNAGCPDVGVSPPLSRAHSEGGPHLFDEKGTSEKAGPRHWRPAGSSKLPPAPPSEMRSARSYAHLDDIGEGGGYSEARARDRDYARDKAPGLFGPRGLMGELARMQEMPIAPVRRAPVGAPSNGLVRAEERQNAKEARVQEMLAEQANMLEAERLHVERMEAKVLRRRTPGSSSMPALPSARGYESPGSPSKEDTENKQRLRIQCKMQMVDFFSGYQCNVNKMSVEETKALLAKLHGGLHSGNDLVDASYPPSCVDGQELPPEEAPRVVSESEQMLAAALLPSSNEAERPSSVRERPLSVREDGYSNPGASGPFLDGNGYNSNPGASGPLASEWPVDWPPDNWTPEASMTPGEDQSIQGRLQSLNDMCNKAFDSRGLEDEGF